MRRKCVPTTCTNIISLSYIGVSDNLLPKLMAICYGLLIVWEKGYHQVYCETDSKDAIFLIFTENCHSHVYYSVIMDIQHQLCKSQEVELIHVLREANSYANLLANEGSRVNEVYIILDEPTPNLRALLAVDYRGTYSLRH